MSDIWLPRLQTEDAQSGYELAVNLSRMAVKMTQPDAIMAAEKLVHAGFRKPLIIHPTDQERRIMGTIAA